MANFKVEVVEIDAIEEHPNADAIELARIGGYVSIVKKESFKEGDLAVYIPEGAVVPEWLIRKLGLWDEKNEKGKFAGSKGNRVKAVKLRGIVSQGVLYPVSYIDASNTFTSQEMVDQPYVQGEDERIGKAVEIFSDVTEFLGITKYEPPIPVHMAGEVCNLHGYTLGYDIENIQKYPGILQEGEEVVITEKLHGTWCCIGFNNNHDMGNEVYGGDVIITSKGMSDKGLAFKWNEANKDNLYVRAFKTMFLEQEGVLEHFRRVVRDKWCPFDMENYHQDPIYLLGEIFGTGVQDLQYGEKKPAFRGFDIYLGSPGQGRYLDYVEKKEIFSDLNIPMVPILYRGPWDEKVAIQYRDGKETVSGKETCIREGIVITPEKERREIALGRVTLKWVSPDYLLRRSKNATEYN